MTTLIRIEHTNGYGLWSARKDDGYSVIDDVSFYGDILRKHNKMPTPYLEGLPFTKEHFCAFKTIDELQEWVDKSWFVELFNLGFKVLMIDVSDVIVGKYQAIFKKTDVLQTKDISNLFL